MGEAVRFAVGSRVRAAAVDPPHHTGVPRYVRGQVGVVVELQGAWPLADDRAQGFAAPRVEPVYTVRFSADDLWGGATGHWVQVELWESYLEEVA
jgi:Nitrile hydratase beta subunit, C-terminal